jgi:hypothetical protein
MNYEDIVRKIKEISGYDPSEMPGPDAPLQAAKGAMRLKDSVTGAPTRAALQAMQHGEPMGEAFAKQFGERPETAPSGKQLLENDPTTAPYASEGLGLALEATLDPTLPASITKAPSLSEVATKFPKLKKLAKFVEPKVVPTSVLEPGAVTSKRIKELGEFAEMAAMTPKTPLQEVGHTFRFMKDRPGMSPEIAMLQTNPNQIVAARLEKRLDKMTPEYYYDTEMGKLVHDPKLLRADEVTKEIPTEESVEAYKKILEMMAKRKKSN